MGEITEMEQDGGGQCIVNTHRTTIHQNLKQTLESNVHSTKCPLSAI